MELILIGHWLGDNEPGYPDVHEFVDPGWDAQERLAVVAWLRTGEKNRVSDHLGTVCAGFSRCRLCGMPNGSDELTDGVFVWPEGLAHYVAGHAVRLGAPIVRHALRQEIERQDLTDLEALPISNSWWRRQRPDWKIHEK